MGFKYKKFEVRSGEVVEPNRIRENMQTLAHEINGSLDRENLPEKCISTDMIKSQTFNDMLTSHSFSVYSTENQSNRFEELMSKEVDVPVDCVVIAHFGTYWDWHLATDSAGNFILDTVAGTTVSTNWNNHIVDLDHYDEIQEHFVEYRLRINGETVCNAPRYSFLRQNQSTYLTGTLQCVAGKIKVSVDVKMYRDNLGTREASTGLYVKVRDRNLVIQAKKR